MAQLLVRNLDDALVKKLKQRASQKGHSTEEEHRMILREVLYQHSIEEQSLKSYLASMPLEDEDELDLPDRNHPSERTVEL
jgi:plasmid stability protein